MIITLTSNIRDLLLGWAKQPCPKCGDNLTFEEPCEGAPVEISCDECHIDFESTDIVARIRHFVDLFDIPSGHPVDVWNIGFEHDGINIINPLLSACSRYSVDPVAVYGLKNILGWLQRAAAAQAIELIEDLINAVETLQGLCGNEPPDDADQAAWTQCEVTANAAQHFIDTIKETS